MGQISSKGTGKVQATRSLTSYGIPPSHDINRFHIITSFQTTSQVDAAGDNESYQPNKRANQMWKTHRNITIESVLSANKNKSPHGLVSTCGTRKSQLYIRIDVNPGLTNHGLLGGCSPNSGNLW
jgi:hypothetical protein